MKNFKSMLAMAALAVAVPFNAANAAFSQVVSFGDSLSDTGNILTFSGGAFPGAPNLPGRFSNGTTWNENLATDLGLSAPTASNVGGSNYAWGGARVTVGTGLGNVPSATEQIGQYLLGTGGVADPNALYTFLIGGNDINGLGGDPGDGSFYGLVDLNNDAIAAAGLVDQLLAAGAQNVLVLNVPDLGGAPVADGNEANATAATQAFNAAFQAALTPSPFVALVDAFAVSQATVAGAPGNGFTNVDDACWNGVYGAGSVVCANPNEYLFWDAIHPTAAGHETIGDAALTAALTLPSASPIPVPAALPLFVTALAGFGAARRFRKAA